MNIGKWLSQGLFGVSIMLASGALLCGPTGEARANVPGSPLLTRTCTCNTDTCTTNPTGPCCQGFCDCTPNECGCRANAGSPTGASCQ